MIYEKNVFKFCFSKDQVQQTAKEVAIEEYQLKINGQTLTIERLENEISTYRVIIHLPN
jgi:hypothetical protein